MAKSSHRPSVIDRVAVEHNLTKEEIKTLKAANIVQLADPSITLPDPGPCSYYSSEIKVAWDYLVLAKTKIKNLWTPVYKEKMKDFKAERLKYRPSPNSRRKWADYHRGGAHSISGKVIKNICNTLVRPQTPDYRYVRNITFREPNYNSKKQGETIQLDLTLDHGHTNVPGYTKLVVTTKDIRIFFPVILIEEQEDGKKEYVYDGILAYWIYPRTTLEGEILYQNVLEWLWFSLGISFWCYENNPTYPGKPGDRHPLKPLEANYFNKKALETLSGRTLEDLLKKKKGVIEDDIEVFDEDDELMYPLN